jgi:hypothetical protein
MNRNVSTGYLFKIAASQLNWKSANLFANAHLAHWDSRRRAGKPKSRPEAGGPSGLEAPAHS